MKQLCNLTEKEEALARHVNHYQHMRFLKWVIDNGDKWRKIYDFQGKRMSDDECKRLSNELIQNHFSDMNFLLIAQYPWVFGLESAEKNDTNSA